MPGQSGNPKGRPPGELTLPKRLRPILSEPASAFPWSRRVANRLGFDERETERMQVGDLVAHSALYHACTGKARYFVELCNRLDGKVQTRIEGAGADGPRLVVTLVPSEPPPDWYPNVRELIGNQPGDPLLPGETAGDSSPDQG